MFVHFLFPQKKALKNSLPIIQAPAVRDDVSDAAAEISPVGPARSWVVGRCFKKEPHGSNIQFLINKKTNRVLLQFSSKKPNTVFFFLLS